MPQARADISKKTKRTRKPKIKQGDWRKKLNKKKYYYSGEAANRVISFIERFCTHLKGELQGQPLILEEWQKEDIIRPAFGILHKTGEKKDLRRYVTVFVEIPRKNGKSALASAIGTYLLLGDREMGGEIVACAADKDQARIVFETSQAMINNNPRLSAACEVLKQSIYHKKSQSVYKVISSVAETKLGLNCSGVVFDELLAQKNRSLYDVLYTSISARKQPFFFCITTAGLKGSFAKSIHDMAIGIRDGKLKDDTFLPVIYSADETDQPYDPATWKKANPGLGTIKKMAVMQMYAQRAKNSPSFLNTFKQLDLNIWTGTETAWLGAGEWEACNYGKKKLKDMGARQCWGGIDLAYTRDLMSFCLFFPPVYEEKKGKKVVTEKGQIFVWFWCPEETIKRRTELENINYDVWVREGYIYTIPGNANDTTYVSRFIVELPENINIQSIGYDRWRANELVTYLTDEGLNMVPFGQGFASMSTPSEALENIILSKAVNHQSNPVLDWQIDNVVMLKDASGNIKPSKARSKDKIDGVVALIIAIGIWLSEMAKPDEKSRYEQDGNELGFV